MGLFHRVSNLLGRHGPPPGLGTFEARYTVLDTELTGLDERKDGIIALGAVRMAGKRLLVGNSFHELVNPRAPLEGRSVVIHGILPSQIEAKPPIDSVLPAFLDYAEGSVLVGHCLAIDLAFLNREARRLRGAPLRFPALDTLAAYGWLRSRYAEHPAFQAPLAGLTLYTLAACFEIPVDAAHTALGDAYVTAQLFMRFLPLLAEAGVTHLGSLLRIADPWRQAENLLPARGRMPF